MRTPWVFTPMTHCRIPKMVSPSFLLSPEMRNRGLRLVHDVSNDTQGLVRSPVRLITIVIVNLPAALHMGNMFVPLPLDGVTNLITRCPAHLRSEIGAHVTLRKRPFAFSELDGTHFGLRSPQLNKPPVLNMSGLA